MFQEHLLFGQSIVPGGLKPANSVKQGAGLFRACKPRMHFCKELTEFRILKIIQPVQVEVLTCAILPQPT